MSVSVDSNPDCHNEANGGGVGAAVFVSSGTLPNKSSDVASSPSPVRDASSALGVDVGTDSSVSCISIAVTEDTYLRDSAIQPSDTQYNMQSNTVEYLIESGSDNTVGVELD